MNCQIFVVVIFSLFFFVFFQVGFVEEFLLMINCMVDVNQQVIEYQQEFFVFVVQVGVCSDF